MYQKQPGLLDFGRAEKTKYVGWGQTEEEVQSQAKVRFCLLSKTVRHSAKWLRVSSKIRLLEF